MKQLLEYWPVLVVGLQSLAVWACWSMRQVSANAVKAAEEKSLARDKVLEDRIDLEVNRSTVLEGRVSAIEHEVDQLPTKADLERVAGSVRVVDSKIDQALGGIQRLEGYHLERGLGVRG
jgi:hypothetical protein